MYIVLLSLVTFLFDGGVATVERSFAPFVNPAGIAISPGLETSYLLGINGGDATHTIGLSMGGIGFGTEIRGAERNFILSSGLRIKDWIYFGSGYRFGDIGGYNIGTIIRPHRFLSIGVVGDKIGDRYLVSSGIGVRPGTDRITLTIDGVLEQGKVPDYRFGARLEPVDGIFIEGYWDEDIWRAGISLSLGNIGFGGKIGGTENYNAAMVLSRERHPTFKKPAPRFAELILKGSYPELERSGTFFEKISAPFYNLLSRIEALSKEDACKGILLELKGARMPMSQWEELRDALVDFKAEGKKVYIYGTHYGFGSLYLASVADSVFLHPAGMVFIPGIQARMIYIKGTMEKLGIEAQIERVGRFKSASEAFEREDMSEEDSLQLMEYLMDIYYPTIETIAEARDISKDSLKRLIDEGIFFTGESAREAGLIDAVWERKRVDSLVFGENGDRFRKEREVKRGWREDKEKGKIALVIAEGTIIEGRSSDGWIGSDDMVNTLEKVRDDESIKAVVFRVNSGGGSAIASEMIAEALKDVAEEKPVVVSMGGVAASGGYFISAYGDRIYANNSTLTGSIGVIWAGILFKGLYDKIGVSWDIVKLGRHADIGSDIRKWDDHEREKIRRAVEWVYNRFTSTVADGRDTTVEHIHSIGEGRIWSGVDAKEIGLVDEIGGMLTALKSAQEMADIEERDVVIYPKPERGFRFDPTFGISSHLSSIKSLLSSEYLYIMPYKIDVEVR